MFFVNGRLKKWECYSWYTGKLKGSACSCKVYGKLALGIIGCHSKRVHRWKKSVEHCRGLAVRHTCPYPFGTPIPDPRKIPRTGQVTPIAVHDTLGQLLEWQMFANVKLLPGCRWSNVCIWLISVRWYNLVWPWLAKWTTGFSKMNHRLAISAHWTTGLQFEFHSKISEVCIFWIAENM